MSADPETTRKLGPLFWVSAAIGWALILWGVRGALHYDLHTRPGQLARFLVGGLLLHDIVLAPLVLGLGWLVARSVPVPYRSLVQAGLVISGCVALFAYPLVRGYGRVLNNPTSLPHNYGANLAVVLSVVWLAVGALVAAKALRRDRGQAER